jgi:lactoylglutathione lyase
VSDTGLSHDARPAQKPPAETPTGIAPPRPAIAKIVRFDPRLKESDMSNRVHELRLVVTTEDYDDALRFYRDVLGLSEHDEFISPGGGRVSILEAGRATLELADPQQAEFVDEVEVGRRVAGHIRVAFEVDDPAAMTAELAAAGGHVLAGPTHTPWNSLNARLEAPAGLQLTLFGQPAGGDHAAEPL